MVLIVAFGTPTAWFLASRRFRGRTLLITLAELPIVLPPAVAGIGLIVAFGRVTFLGRHLAALGIQLSFDQTAVDFAIMLVAGPFYIRQAIASFEAVDTWPLDRSLPDARRRARCAPSSRSPSRSPARGARRPGIRDQHGARAGRVRGDDHVRR